MPSSSALPSTQYLDDLYTLARVLAGPDHADDLVETAYATALETSLEDRPDDQRAWLLRHLLDAHAAHRASDPAAASVANAVRQQAAEAIAARALPAAFAACSARERLILTLDVQATQPDTKLRDVLDRVVSSNGDRRAEAWSALRASLRDTLTGPERMLVDVALSEDAMQDALRTMLADHMRPAPASLRRTVAQIVRDANRPDDEDDASADDDARFDAVSSGVWVRRVAVGLFLVILLGLGGYGLFQSLSPAPEPNPDLVAFSARRADGVRPDLETSDRVAAEKYIQTQMGRRLTAPVLTDARLQGVGVLNAGAVAVPVLLYADSTTGGRITVAAYSYAVLDRIEDRVPIDTELRSRLSEEGAMIQRRAGTESVVVWRRRDDVFVAVAGNTSPQRLSQQIRP
mgnify:CR=1 FL=1